MATKGPSRSRYHTPLLPRGEHMPTRSPYSRLAPRLLGLWDLVSRGLPTLYP